MNYIISFLLSSLSFGASAHNLNLPTYLQMQEALANDDFKAALSAHETICKKELIHYTDDYKDCKKNFKEISDLRESFKSLSTVFIANGEKEELRKALKVSCPMAKAKWIQKEGPIKNPYYGKAMLECGEKI